VKAAICREISEIVALAPLLAGIAWLTGYMPATKHAEAGLKI
jgi:hypothetical protein